MSDGRKERGCFQKKKKKKNRTLPILALIKTARNNAKEIIK